MNVGDLLELAAVVTAHGPSLIRDCRQLAPEALEQYWSASKCRQQRWAQALKQLSGRGDRPSGVTRTTTSSEPRPDRRSLDLSAILQEIFGSEVLTRVWTAVVAAHDRRRQTADAEPIARSVLIGHLEARHRALMLLVQGSEINLHDADELNRLRRRAERWNDMLVGHLLASEEGIDELAFDPDLAREFSDDFRGQPTWQAGGPAWSLVSTSLPAGWRSSLGNGGCNRDLNAQIGAAILGCFECELLDSFELPRSLWTARLFQTADRARGMIETMFASERGTSFGDSRRLAGPPPW